MRTATSRYFDAASAAPPHPVALDALNAALEDGWADPTRVTNESRRAARLLDAARASLAAELGIEPDELVFTGSAAISAHLAVLGSLAGRAGSGQLIAHSAVEHSAFLKAAEWHGVRGGTALSIGVDEVGRVLTDVFVAATQRPETGVAVLQAANHEVGTRQSIAEIAALTASRQAPLVVDATHTMQFEPLPLLSGPSVFTGDARTWGGPSGLGLLVVRRGTRWRNPFPTDEAENARGSGAVNIPAAVAAAAALRAVRADASATTARVSSYIDRIRANVPHLVDDCEVLGDPHDRLPHIVTFSCLHVDGEAMLNELSRRGFSVSSGSSCTSDTLTPSHVLVAMGALTSGNIRVSLHGGVGDEDIDEFLDVLPEVVRATRAQLPNSRPFVPNTVVNAPKVIDARGKRCPLPVLELAKAWPDVKPGDDITIWADDPAAANDIAAWVRMRGQVLVSSDPIDETAAAYRVRRLS